MTRVLALALRLIEPSIFQPDDVSEQAGEASPHVRLHRVLVEGGGVHGLQRRLQGKHRGEGILDLHLLTLLTLTSACQVASQCLQSAYAFNAQEDKHLKVRKNLEDIFKEAVKDEPVRIERLELKSFFTVLQGRSRPNGKYRRLELKKILHLQCCPQLRAPSEPVSDDNKKKAEELKEEGNKLMTDQKFDEAVKKYTE